MSFRNLLTFRVLALGGFREIALHIMQNLHKLKIIQIKLLLAEIASVKTMLVKVRDYAYLIVCQIEIFF